MPRCSHGADTLYCRGCHTLPAVTDQQWLHDKGYHCHLVSLKGHRGAACTHSLSGKGIGLQENVEMLWNRLLESRPTPFSRRISMCPGWSSMVGPATRLCHSRVRPDACSSESLSTG